MDKENKCYQCGGSGCNHCQLQGDSDSSVTAGSVAPTWYTKEELEDYLSREHFDDVVAKKVGALYARNLQEAFEKGYRKGLRAQ